MKNGTKRKALDEQIKEKENIEARKKDWYYNLKKEREIEKKMEDDTIATLNPIVAWFYQNCYLRCCKKKEKYSFKAKSNSKKTE